MPDRSSKKEEPGPKDPNQLAARMVRKPAASNDSRDPAAVELGRKGGIKGGPARAKALTAKQRTEAARNAARARWSNRD